MLDLLAIKHEQEKGELHKLMQKKHLSPRSMKKKLQLERWVTKQEEQLFNQKKMFNQNVQDIMQKIDKDLKQTMKRLGAKKTGGINNSVEWSLQDTSLGGAHNQSISINSTPRIDKASPHVQTGN